MAKIIDPDTLFPKMNPVRQHALTLREFDKLEGEEKAEAFLVRKLDHNLRGSWGWARKGAYAEKFTVGYYVYSPVNEKQGYSYNLTREQLDQNWKRFT